MPTQSQRTASPDQVSAAQTRAADRGNSLEYGTVTDRSGATMDTMVAKGGHSMAANPAFEADAIAFERALGIDAFTRGLPAAEALSAKAKDYLVAKHGAWERTNTELEAALASIGADNPGWSGAVGTAMDDLMAVFDTGNLATRMNHVGNFFTTILGGDLVAADPEMDRWVAEAKLNARQVEAKRVNSTGNAWTTAVQRPADSEVQGQGLSRVASGEDKRTQLTVESSGVSLDPGEERLQAQAAADRGETWDPRTGSLAWQEGARTWALNEKNAWVASMRELSLPLAAGPSGTTDMLMNASKTLGGVSAVDTRLACIGYLLPANHHSLVEVMTAAASHGAPMTQGQQMYTNIQPYSAGELRGFGGGKFPHERHPDSVT